MSISACLFGRLVPLPCAFARCPLSVQLWNAYFTKDEFIGHCSIDFSVLRLKNAAMLLSGMRWYQLEEGGELQLSPLFVDEQQDDFA